MIVLLPQKAKMHNCRYFKKIMSVGHENKAEPYAVTCARNPGKTQLMSTKLFQVRVDPYTAGVL